MVVKFFYIFVVVFTVGIIFIVFQDPYDIQELKKNLNVATMTMYKVEDYEIGETIGSKYKAEVATRYNDRDEFKNFDGFYIKGDTNHSLTSNDAIYKGNILTFKNNAFYSNSDNVTYNSDEIVYDINKKEISSKKDFVLTQNENKVIGKEILYKMEDKKIYAKKVKGWSQLEN